MNIWTYVSFLGGIVVIAILMVILFETINTFIDNRKREKATKEIREKTMNILSDEVSKKIKEEIDKTFKNL